MFEKFFNDPSFDFETRTLFGAIHYGAGDVGEMLTAVASITDGDAASWVSEWRTLARTNRVDRQIPPTRRDTRSAPATPI